MKTQNSIPKRAFSLMMSAFAYFDKVDGGCGYERFGVKKMQIKAEFGLTDEELGKVEEWAYKKYYA